MSKKTGEDLINNILGLNDINVEEYDKDSWNYVNKENKTPLIACVDIFGFGTRMGPIIESLIKKGADINFQNEDIDPPLIYSLKWAYTDSTKFLINQGANLDITNRKEETALIEAIKNDNKEIVKLLIEKGANVNLGSEDGYSTPLIQSIKSEYEYNIEIATLLIKNGANVNSVTKDNYSTPLIECIKTDNVDKIEFAKLLIANGADVNFVNENGLTPLIICLNKGGDKNIEFVKLLVDSGADINYVNIDDSVGPPLIECIKYKYTYIFSFLMQNEKININIQNSDGITPLIQSILNFLDDDDESEGAGETKSQNDYEKIIYMFNAIINNFKDKIHYSVIDNNGETALFKAAGITSPEQGIVYSIMEGTNINQHINKEEPQSTFILLLQNNFVDGEFINFIQGIDVDYVLKNFDGYNALTTSILYGYNNMNVNIVAKFLIDTCIVDINIIINDNGFNLLFLSIDIENNEISEYLIDKGIDLEHADGAGDNALHLSLYRKNENIAIKLIEKGVDIILFNNAQKSPLMLSVSFNLVEVTKILLDRGAYDALQDRQKEDMLYTVIDYMNLVTESKNEDGNMVQNNLNLSIINLFIERNIDLLDACTRHMAECFPSTETEGYNYTVLRNLFNHYTMGSVNCSFNKCNSGYSINDYDEEGDFVRYKDMMIEGKLKGILLNPSSRRPENGRDPDDVLCINIDEEINYWNAIGIYNEDVHLDAKNFESTYTGFVAKPVRDGEYIKAENNTQFVNFISRQDLFFLRYNIPIILNSKNSLFVLYKLKEKWFDIHSGILSSKHHNYDKNQYKIKGRYLSRDSNIGKDSGKVGDNLYLIIPCK